MSLIHYQQNLGCEEAEFVVALNSDDPGSLTMSERTFSIPQEALEVKLIQY